MSNAFNMADALAKVLPIKQAQGNSADVGSLVGTDGTAEPEAAVSKATLANGNGTISAMQPVSQGIWIDQESTVAAAAVEQAWIASSASFLSTQPAYCDTMVFYGDWLDRSASPGELATGLRAIGVTCTQEAGLSSTGVTPAAAPTSSVQAAITPSTRSSSVDSLEPASTPTFSPQLFPATDTNIQLAGYDGASTAWSVPQDATTAQARALTQVYTSGPLMVLFRSLAIVSNGTAAPTSDNDVGMQIQWSSAVTTGGNWCYVFNFDLLADNSVVYSSGNLSGQTSASKLSQLEGPLAPGGSEYAGASLPQGAASWITRWDTIDVTYDPNSTC